VTDTEAGCLSQEDTQASLRKLKGAGDSTRAAIETVTGLSEYTPTPLADVVM